MYTQFYTIQGLFRVACVGRRCMYYCILYKVCWDQAVCSSAMIRISFEWSCVERWELYTMCAIHCIVNIEYSRDPYSLYLENRDLYTSSLESLYAAMRGLCRRTWLTMSFFALSSVAPQTVAFLRLDAGQAWTFWQLSLGDMKVLRCVRTMGRGRSWEQGCMSADGREPQWASPQCCSSNSALLTMYWPGRWATLCFL